MITNGPHLGDTYDPANKEFIKEKEEKKKPQEQTFIITGSVLLLGEPSTGDYSKGLFKFDNNTLTADAIQQINEELKNVRSSSKSTEEK